MVNSNHGFTLLEVLIGLAIVGVIAAAGIPGMISVIDKQTLKVKVSRINSLVDQARNLAATTECPVQMDFKPVGEAVTVDVKVENNSFLKGCSAWYAQTTNANSRQFAERLDNVTLSGQAILNFNAVTGVLNTNNQTRLTLNYKSRQASITFVGIGNGVVEYE